MTVNTANLVAYYKLDGNSNDATGNGHNGTDTSVTYGAGTGIINQAANFDGTSGHCIVVSGNSTDFDFSASDFSLSFWVKFGSTQVNYAGLVSKGNPTTGPNDWAVQRNSSTADMYFYLGSHPVTFTGAWGTLDNNTYHHVVITGTVATKTLLLYIDGGTGVSGSSSYWAANTATNDIRIGSSRDNLVVNGAVDELGIWKGYVLTSGEVTALYNSGAGLQYPFGGGTTVNATVGSFTWGGLASPLSTQINAGIGGYTWQGKPSPLITTINATVGSYAFSGLSSPLSAQINASVGGYAWSGLSAPLSAQINAAIGTWTWSGKASSIITTPSINATVGTWTWGGQFSPLATQLNAGVGGWTMQGIAAAVTTPSVQLSPQLRFGSDRAFTAASDRSFGVGSGANWKAKRYGLIN